MADNEGWGRRLRDARRDWEKVADAELDFKEIGKEIAALIGRRKHYTPQAVSKWFGGSEPESFAVVEALGTILGVPPGELAFGALATAVPSKDHFAFYRQRAATATEIAKGKKERAARKHGKRRAS